jgi:hypothetical protein
MLLTGRLLVFEVDNLDLLADLNLTMSTSVDEVRLLAYSPPQTAPNLMHRRHS